MQTLLFVSTYVPVAELKTRSLKVVQLHVAVAVGAWVVGPPVVGPWPSTLAWVPVAPAVGCGIWMNQDKITSCKGPGYAPEQLSTQELGESPRLS